MCIPFREDHAQRSVRPIAEQRRTTIRPQHEENLRLEEGPFGTSLRNRKH